MDAEVSSQKRGAFLTDIEEIRRRGRQHIEKGAVTPGYRSDLKTVLRVLNEALATELVCVLRYKRHHYMAKGIHSQSVAAEFLEHAAEEQGHADQIAARIIQLGGQPDFSPERMLTRSHTEYVEGETLRDMIREDLVAERIAIESYTEIIHYLGDKDPTSRWIMEAILANEARHAEDMKALLQAIGQEEGQHVHRVAEVHAATTRNHDNGGNHSEAKRQRYGQGQTSRNKGKDQGESRATDG
jgi:bacterioferritin